MALSTKGPRKGRVKHAAEAPRGAVTTDLNGLKPELQLIAYGPAGFYESSEPDLEAIPALRKKWPVLWLHVGGLGDAEVLAAIGRTFDIHRLALEDVLAMNQRAKIEDYDKRLFVVMRILEPGPTVRTGQLSIFVGDGFAVTFQEHPVGCLDPIRKRIREGLGPLRTMAADYLAYSIIDAAVDAYFPYLDDFSEKLGELEDDALYRPTPEIAARIHEAKRDLLALRRAMAPMREGLGALVLGGAGHISETTRLHLRDCYDHCIMLLEMMESYRELTGSLLDVYLSSVGNRMNEIMKMLTLISTIFIPLSFLTGLYGMNFDHHVSPWNMPELHTRYGYPIFLGVVLAIGIFQLLLYWKRGWFGGVRGKPVVPPEERDRDQH
ncbi:MAG TPA: magnesium/cobalt transporter CorA [Candidatus Hydrogenedentes bacterium]|nr:magnesium/cobalt transporter CorA [Candidatus Hydrogenedentota bacterium]